MRIVTGKSNALFGLCKGKLKFSSWKIAVKYAEQREQHNGDHTEPYHCLECNDFHLRSVVKVRKSTKKGRQSREFEEHLEE